MSQLTELDRRVLGHLPAWAADEAAHVAMEERFSPGSIRSYGLAEFTERLAEDPNAVGVDRTGDVRHLEQVEVARALDDLVDRGLAFAVVEGDEARWRMTEAGFDALTGPQRKPDQIPGPVEVGLNPAVVEVEVSAGVEASS